MDEQEARELVRWLKECRDNARALRRQHAEAMDKGEADAQHHYDFARGFVAAYDNVLWKLPARLQRGIDLDRLG